MKFFCLSLGLLILVVTPVLAQTNLRTEFQDTQPKFISEGEGKFSGLCLEIMALMERKSEFRFAFVPAFVPISRITEDLKASQIDVYFGLAKTPQREKDFGFVGELFRTRYQLVARKGDPLASATKLDEIRASSVPLMVIRGTAQANYYQKTLSLPTFDAPSSVEVALKQLKAGEGRLFGYYDLGNEWYLASLGFREALTTVPVVLDEDGQWLCVSSTLPAETVGKLGKLLEGLKKTPEWAALMKKYFG